MANKVKTEEQPAAQLLRMDNVAIVVQDLDAAIQFFAELGLVLEGRMQVEGDGWTASSASPASGPRSQ